MTKARIREIRSAAKKCGEGWMPAMEAMVIELIEELERLQSFTRRGQSEPEPEPLPEKANGKQTKDPRIAEFIDGWHNAFLERFKEKYKVQGVKDAVAVKRLLATGSTVDDLLDLAWEAWKHPDKFNCKQAATILGLEQRFNDIRIELKTIASNGQPQHQGAPSVVL